MTDDGSRSEFEREVETYRDAMDSLHRTAGDHSRNLAGLDDAMGRLKQSVAEMTDAVDEYDHAIDELDDAVVSLGRHASQSGGGAPATPPVAGD
jgi:chromosome segregation ATPase